MSLWRNRDFRIAWSAVLVNDAGDWVLAVALPVFVFVETGSGAATAILFVLQFLAGALLGPIGGSLVDRWDLRRVLIWTNLAQAAALLPLLAVTGDRIWPAYIAMGAQSALIQLNNPASISLLPRVVAEDELTGANAALSAAASFARLGGAALGGVLVAWGGLGPIIVVDAVSFLAVATAVRFIKADTSPAAASHDERKGRLQAALRTIKTHPPLAQVLSLQGFAQIAQGGFVVLFVVFLVQELGDDGSGLGLIRGTMAIGALIGAAIINRVSKRIDPLVLFSVGLVGMGVVSLIFWNAPYVTTMLWVYVALFALSGIPGAALTVGLFTTVQSRTPRPTVGRVVGLMGTGESIGVATGSIIAGALVDHVSLAPILNGQATIYLIAGALALLLVAPHRAIRRRPVPEPVTICQNPDKSD
jgi:MFS family permease